MSCKVCEVLELEILDYDDEKFVLDVDFEGEVIEVGGGITKETDPTVPDWAKQPNPPIDIIYNPNSKNAQSGKAVNEAVMTRVPTTRKIVDVDLTNDITAEELQKGLSVYPVLYFENVTPVSLYELKGEIGQLLINITNSGATIYRYCGIVDKLHRWEEVVSNSKLSYEPYGNPDIAPTDKAVLGHMKYKAVDGKEALWVCVFSSTTGASEWVRIPLALNIVTEVNENSTDNQIPSARLFYNKLKAVGTGASGGNGTSETLVFEHNFENHSARTVTAIDFENFTMTLDDVSGIPTDTSGRVQSYVQLELFDGNAIKANVMPIELITKPFKVQSIGDNKVQLLDNSNNVIQFSDTGNIDLTKFKLCVNKTPHSNCDITNLDTTHKYRVELDINGFHHFTAGIALRGCTSGVQNGNTFAGIGTNPNTGQLMRCSFGEYSDTISLRGMNESAGTGTTSCLPIKYVATITPELCNGKKRTLVQFNATWLGYRTNNFRLESGVVYATGWVNNEIHTVTIQNGNANFFGTGRVKVYDCGEVEL